ncbi:MAG: signal recognition particle protein [Candidatus Sericytochromatia bacterium]|nr:MAG: signal recognition particle protein [Candidatus Sericytochromatia bacterium]
MFESLSERLQEVFKKISGKGKITEENISEAIREVKRALLEADVNLKVVKDFINNVKEKAIGHDVIKSISPGQQFIKIVNDELVELMGGENKSLEISEKTPTIYMMVGLQGSGKTTTSAKLALFLKKQGKRPLLVAADIYRPAAIKQLEVLGKQINIPVFSLGQIDPVDIAEQAIKYAKKNGHDFIILDTAGRLHIDIELMNELVRVRDLAKPTEILLVVDAMIGQDAVNMAKTFDEYLNITGVIITKLDGDTRGGAALSVKAVTGKPIKFMALGEKLEALELFHPERIASRILGMGDIITLVEKAQATIDEKEAKELEKKLRKSEFNLEDFLNQMKSMKKLGSLEQLIGMLPGLGGKLKSEEIAEGEKQMKKIEAIINSMTKEERRNPEIFNVSRKNRVAKGSGTTIQEVNKLLKQFSEMRKMIKEMSNMGLFGGGFGKKGKQLKKMMKALETQMKVGDSTYGDILNPEKFLGKVPNKFPFKK